jgi:hypothetical protein
MAVRHAVFISRSKQGLVFAVGEMSERADDADVGSSTTQPVGGLPKKFPRGVVLGKDGKPCVASQGLTTSLRNVDILTLSSSCRTCTSFASWAAMTKAQISKS